MNVDPLVEITHLGRPVTMNAILGAKKLEWGHRGRIAWRDAAHAAAVELGLPEITTPCAVDATVLYGGGPIQDVGACAPTVKAVIDGLVLAGWLNGDDPAHIARIIYSPHELTNGVHGLRVRVIDL